MKRTWVVVMDRVGARLFERMARQKKLNLIREWDLSTGGSEVGHNGAPIVSATAHAPEHDRRRGGRAPVPQETPAHKEQSLKKFCREISGYLELERNTSHFDDLVLVAEPHTLGVLKQSLGDQLTKKVASTIDKDFAWVETRDIPELMDEYFV